MDEWSLKGKEIDTWRSGKKRGKHWNNYNEKVIETLRQKLISEIQMELYSRNGLEFLHGIVEIINKRFGVK